MMQNAFHGIHAKRLDHLRRAVSAHRAVMEGIATHAEKEHARRQAHATAKRATEAISGPFKGSGQSLRSHYAVLRDERVRVLGRDMEC